MIKMIKEGKNLAAFSTFIRTSWKVGIFYIHRALLIQNLAPLYDSNDGLHVYKTLHHNLLQILPLCMALKCRAPPDFSTSHGENFRKTSLMVWVILKGCQLLTYFEKGLDLSLLVIWGRMIGPWSTSNRWRQLKWLNWQTFSWDLHLWKLVTLQPFNLQILYWLYGKI